MLRKKYLNLPITNSSTGAAPASLRKRQEEEEEKEAEMSEEEDLTEEDLEELEDLFEDFLGGLDVDSAGMSRSFSSMFKSYTMLPESDLIHSV